MSPVDSSVWSNGHLFKELSINPSTNTCQWGKNPRNTQTRFFCWQTWQRRYKANLGFRLYFYWCVKWTIEHERNVTANGNALMAGWIKQTHILVSQTEAVCVVLHLNLYFGYIGKHQSWDWRSVFKLSNCSNELVNRRETEENFFILPRF